MRKCAICKKQFDVLYPDLWRYKRGDGGNIRAWFCSWKCLREYDKRKEEGKMARPRKDGTPARKPQRKKAEVQMADKLPEEPKVELVYDESIAEEYRKEQAAKNELEAPKEWIPAEKVYGIAQDAADDQPIVPEKVKNIINGMEAEDVQVTAIRVKGLGEFYFDKKFGTVDWRSDTGEEISLTPADWEKLRSEIQRMLRILGAED